MKFTTNGKKNSYREYKKKYCEKCGKKEKLIVHHIDGNRNNNKIKNLMTICESCHKIEHKIVKNFHNAYKKMKRNKYGCFGKKIKWKNIICKICRINIKTISGRKLYCNKCSYEIHKCQISQLNYDKRKQC